jgi:hypothetical protein
LKYSCEEGFLHQAQFDLLIITADPVDLLDRMAAFQPKFIEKWEVK